MCGIVGIYLKTKKYEKHLGKFLSGMLDGMATRGPDSAGFAIYTKENKNIFKYSICLNELKEKDWYINSISKNDTSFLEDKDLVIKIFKEIIAPNDKLYEYIEDKRLTWLDDFPLVNTLILKMLQKISDKNIHSILIPEVYKNKEDRDYAIQLFQKVILNDDELSKEIDGKTPNWDKERIADLDMIILKMGISEFVHFESIPVKATINEYLEVSKEYSTPKSSIFINGILDKIVKDLKEAGKLNKIGRGLK